VICYEVIVTPYIPKPAQALFESGDCKFVTPYILQPDEALFESEVIVRPYILQPNEALFESDVVVTPYILQPDQTPFHNENSLSDQYKALTEGQHLASGKNVRWKVLSPLCGRHGGERARSRWPACGAVLAAVATA
jgi:hypothetical protein